MLKVLQKGREGQGRPLNYRRPRNRDLLRIFLIRTSCLLQKHMSLRYLHPSSPRIHTS
eukprot:XP_001709873.1 Hypothetical protein GL50803_32495 [Giardia lamblia ATCC 50803]